ncbi:putative glutathione peroxidase 8, partial [Bienertia sinuspersici]
MASHPTKNPQSIYDFTVKDTKKYIKLSDYRGKVLLIVNVASKCGMTNSNYTELNQLYDKYKDQGLEILAFPCNQFGDEEPGAIDEIVEFGNGEFSGDDVQWNFAKFLVDKDGQA